MARNQETLNKEMYHFLSSNGYEPKAFDVEGKLLATPDDAALIRFTFKDDEEDLGAARVTIDRENGVTIYFDNDIEHTGSHAWRDFLKQMKDWSMRKQLGFDLQNTERLKYDMAQRQYTEQKEKLGEGYHAMGKNMSYNDNVPSVKIILQHNRKLEEGEQRYRSVAKIFLENTDGERFLAPTTRPGIAQVYARHIAEGGVPNDERWNHVKAICEEYSKMAGFARAVRKGQFNESAQQLVNEGLNHYQSLRETLGKLRGHRGYNMYFESWTPALMEDETDVDTVNQMFVQETMDPRIESVMPILAKLNRNVPQEVKEVAELADWADSITEMDDGIPDNLSPSERKEQKDRDKKEYDKNLKKTPDAIKKKLKLPPTIDEGEEILEIAPVVGAIAGRALAGAAGAGRVGKTVGSVVGQRVAGALSGNDDVEEDLDNKTIYPNARVITTKTGRKVGEQGVAEGGFFDPDQPNPGDMVKHRNGAVGKVKKIGTQGDETWVYFKDENGEMNYGQWKKHVFPLEEQGVAEGSSTMWEVSFDFGPHQSDSVKVRAASEEEARAKTKRAAAKKGYRGSIMINWVKPVKQGVAEEVEEGLDANQKRVGQLGATEKVKNSARGKLVGENIIKEEQNPKIQKLINAISKVGTQVKPNVVKIKNEVTVYWKINNKFISIYYNELDTEEIGWGAGTVKKNDYFNYDESATGTPAEAFHNLKKLKQKLLSYQTEKVGEAVAHDSPEESVIMDIVNGNIDAYDVMNNPNSEAEQKVSGILQDMYERISIDRRLHPDDDFEEIIEIMMDELSSEYDPYPMSESMDEGYRPGEINNGDKVQFKKDSIYYEPGTWTVSRCTDDGKCWIGDEDGRGWYTYTRELELADSLGFDDDDDFDPDFVYGKSEPEDDVDSNDFGDFGDDPRDTDPLDEIKRLLK